MGQKEKMKKHYKDLPISTQVEIMTALFPDGTINISFMPHDPTLNVVVDEDALKSLNTVLSEKLAGMSVKHPNTKPFIKEYCTRWMEEMQKQKLIVLESAWDKE